MAIKKFNLNMDKVSKINLTNLDLSSIRDPRISNLKHEQFKRYQQNVSRISRSSNKSFSASKPNENITLTKFQKYQQNKKELICKQSSQDLPE